MSNLDHTEEMRNEILYSCAEIVNDVKLIRSLISGGQADQNLMTAHRTAVCLLGNVSNILNQLMREQWMQEKDQEGTRALERHMMNVLYRTDKDEVANE